MRIDENPDAVIKIVEFKNFAAKSWAEINPVSDCPFSEARQPPYIHEGNAERLSNISEISKWLLINESEENSRSSFSEQHDESDDKSKRNE